MWMHTSINILSFSRFRCFWEITCLVDMDGVSSSSGSNSYWGQGDISEQWGIGWIWQIWSNKIVLPQIHLRTGRYSASELGMGESLLRWTCRFWNFFGYFFYFKIPMDKRMIFSIHQYKMYDKSMILQKGWHQHEKQQDRH